ncbi:MAG: porin [bacterium]|nr:porin [bacterium]
MLRTFILIMFMACCLSPATPLFANEVDDLKRDLERIQNRLEVLEAEDEQKTHALSDLMEIAGYGDGEFKMTDRKGKNNEFRVHHLSLFFMKRIGDRWRMFSEIEYEDGPNTAKNEGKIFVEVFTLEYYLNQYLNFRLGRFLTPGGIWNVDHYPPFVLTQERPQHIRKIFPQLNDGLQVLGSTHAANVTTDYIFYVSNGQGNTGHGDDNEDKALGARLKFGLPFLSRAEIGTSYYREEQNDKTDFKALGADLLLSWKNMRLQAEYAKGFFDPAAGKGDHRTGYYGQLEYDLKKWTLGYRYDWYDPSRNTDSDRKTINTLALNYHFTPYVVGKAEHHFVDPQDKAADSYNLTLLSIAIYLGK